MTLANSLLSWRYSSSPGAQATKLSRSTKRRVVGSAAGRLAGAELGERAHLALELEPHAERLRARLEDLQQRLALDAAEAVAGRAQDLAADVDLDVVPAREPIRDLAVGLGIRGGEVAERGVGEHDAEPERVGGPVALVDDDVVLRRRALDEGKT
jgi:hypothetical protein